jgi:hypothetical protein
MCARGRMLAFNTIDSVERTIYFTNTLLFSNRNPFFTGRPR